MHAEFHGFSVPDACVCEVRQVVPHCANCCRGKGMRRGGIYSFSRWAVHRSDPIVAVGTTIRLPAAAIPVIPPPKSGFQLVRKTSVALPTGLPAAAGPGEGVDLSQSIELYK